jgi:hypothetical protein
MTPIRFVAMLVIAAAPGFGSCAPGQVRDGLGPPPGELETIALAPGSITLAPDQSQTFQVSGTLTDGSPVSGFGVTWSATGGTITSNGRYTAGTVSGSYVVTATESNSGLAATSTVTVSAATVTALRLTPANVNLTNGATRQFAVSATLSDGSTSSVPVTWDVTGGTITGAGLYTAGPADGTYRVIATSANGLADTSAVTIFTPVITAITVTPATVTLMVGEPKRFTARATLSDGSSLSNPTVTWAATGGTISTSGRYIAGPDTGTFAAWATSANGFADTSIVTIIPAPPVDTTLTNLPQGFLPILDEPWDEVAPQDWSLASFGQNQVSRVDDPTAPRSPSSVLQFIYEGNVGGQGAGGRTYRHEGYGSYYIAFWYKHSSNWEYHSSCYNKLLYFANNASGGTNEGIVHDDCGELSVTQQNGPSRRMRSNVGGAYTITLGQWHFVEIRMVANTGGQANGLLDWWVDGVHRGQYADVQWNPGGDALFDAINLDPIWGGGPQTAAEAQYYWLDHLIVLGKN